MVSYKALNTHIKAHTPILVTLSGIMMLVRELHSKKAHSPILVTLSGMT